MRCDGKTVELWVPPGRGLPHMLDGERLVIPEEATEWCLAVVKIPEHMQRSLEHRIERQAREGGAQPADLGTLPGTVRPRIWKFKACGRARYECRSGLFIEIFCLEGETWPDEKPG